MPNKPGYFGEWYEKNKEDVAERRKKKYEDDPEYREKVLQRSSDYRERQREVSQVRVPRHQRPRMFSVEESDAEVPLYSIGAFAAYINRSVQSINHWEGNGLLPRTPYRVGKRGFRYYSAEMMEVVRRIVGNKRRLFPVDESMGKAIRDAWGALGVPMDCDGGVEEALRQSKFLPLGEEEIEADEGEQASSG
jgi:hypothetical protein